MAAVTAPATAIASTSATATPMVVSVGAVSPTHKGSRFVRNISMPAISTPAMAPPSISTPAISAPAISTPAISAPATTAPTAVSVGAVGAVGPIHKGSRFVRNISMPAISTPAISTPAMAPPAISPPAISTPAISAPATTAPTAVSVGAVGAVGAVGPIHKGSSIVRKASNSEEGTSHLPTRESGMAPGIAAALMVMIARKPKMLEYFIVKVFLWALQWVCQ